MRCPFCGKELALGYFSKIWNDPHYQTFHTEYAEWLGGWVKNFVTVGTIDVLILGIILYLFYSPSTLLAALLLY